VTLLAYSPLEQGLLTGKYGPGTLPAGPRAEAASFAAENLAAAQPVLATLRSIGAAHGVEAAAVALAWLRAQPGVIALAGAKSGEQAAHNARALDLTLSEGELAELDTVTKPWCVSS
jgi:aryl-alcohol dehydrogenase-like predicted oxidoreductase